MQKWIARGLDALGFVTENAMKKEVLIHALFLLAFFIFITLFKKWFAISYLPFWIGGIIGSILPDVDHLIYVYVFKPDEQTSLRVSSLVSKRELGKTLELLATTRSERTELIFHTAYFQIIFLVFAFLVISSSGSLLGSGLVLAFSLHLLIDQAVDLLETDTLANWFKKIPVSLDRRQMNIYLVANIVLLLIFGFLL